MHNTFYVFFFGFAFKRCRALNSYLYGILAPSLFRLNSIESIILTISTSQNQPRKHIVNVKKREKELHRIESYEHGINCCSFVVAFITFSWLHISHDQWSNRIWFFWCFFFHLQQIVKFCLKHILIFSKKTNIYAAFSNSFDDFKRYFLIKKTQMTFTEEVKKNIYFQILAIHFRGHKI